MSSQPRSSCASKPSMAQSFARSAPAGYGPRMRSLRRALAIAILLCVGCPQRFDPRAQPNLSSPNADADKTFRDARTKFEAGQHEAARAEFEKFAQQFPDDPLKPFAKIFSGRASYEKGDYKAARQALEPVASGPPDNAAT